MQVVLKVELVLIVVVDELNALDEDGYEAGIQGVPECFHVRPAMGAAFGHRNWRGNCLSDAIRSLHS